jgi:RND family efflux transporter MFP subunit
MFISTSPLGVDRRAFRLGAISLLSAVLAVSLAACSRPEAVQEPVRAVKVMTVGQSGLDMGGEFAAEVRARVESRLGFRVAGKISQRQAEMGQHVAAGAVLAQLDAADYQLAAQAAQAQVSGARTQRDLAQAEYKRYEGLRAQNFISSAELERREATLKSAQFTLDQALAQAQNQGNQSAYTQLRADAPGVITAVEAEAGQVVTAGTPVFRLAHDGPRDAVFAVSESMVMQLQKGQVMQAVVAQGGPSLQGRVREIAGSADPLTRTFTVKLALDAGEKLPLGATVNVLAKGMQGSQAAVIKVPTSALRQEGQGTAVWVLDESKMTVALQPVQVATAAGNEVVIASGLEVGQRIVTAGVHVLTTGQKVSLYKAPITPAPQR